MSAWLRSRARAASASRSPPSGPSARAPRGRPRPWGGERRLVDGRELGWRVTPCRCRSACDEAFRVASRRRQISARMPDRVAAATTRASKASAAAPGSSRAARRSAFEKTLAKSVTAFDAVRRPRAPPGPAEERDLVALRVRGDDAQALGRKWRIVAAAALKAPWTRRRRLRHAVPARHFVKSTPSTRTEAPAGRVVGVKLMRLAARPAPRGT